MLTAGHSRSSLSEHDHCQAWPSCSQPAAIHKARHRHPADFRKAGLLTNSGGTSPQGAIEQCAAVPRRALPPVLRATAAFSVMPQLLFPMEQTARSDCQVACVCPVAKLNVATTLQPLLLRADCSVQAGATPARQLSCTRHPNVLNVQAAHTHSMNYSSLFVLLLLLLMLMPAVPDGVSHRLWLFECCSWPHLLLVLVPALEGPETV